jgi:hypothetical protein
MSFKREKDKKRRLRMIQKSLATLMLQIKQEFHDDCKSLPKLASTTFFLIAQIVFCVIFGWNLFQCCFTLFLRILKIV